MTRITGETRSARPWIGGLAALGLALCAQVGTVGTATTAFAATAPVCGPSGGAADFNKDFYTDLAIGARGDDGGKGAVTIMAGQGGGLSASNPDNQRWTLDTAGVAGKGQAGAGFGWTVATGDFNGDGYDDVAAGAPLRTSAPPRTRARCSSCSGRRPA